MGILDDAIREHLELKRAHGAPEQEVQQKEAEAFGPVRTDVVAEAPVAEAPAGAPPAAEETQLLQAAEMPAAPVADVPRVEAEDPYAVHPGDAALPDPHREGEPGGKDPAWGDDTDFFSEPAAPEMAGAGAGVLPEGGRADPGPPPPADTPAEPADETSAPEAPVAPQPHHEEHRRVFDTDEHLHAGSEPPQPVYGHEARTPPPEPPPAFDEPTQAHETVPAEDAPVGAEGEGEDEDVLEETPEFLQDAPEHDRLWFEQKPPRDFDFGE